EGRFLRIRPIDGGPDLDVPPGPGQIRFIAWRPDSGAVVTDGDPASGPVVYELTGRTRRPLATAPAPGLRQPVGAPDGRRVAAFVNGREGNELWVFPIDAGGAAIDRGRGERVRTMAAGASFPAWTPRGEIACVASVDGRPRVTLPCGAAVVRTD